MLSQFLRQKFPQLWIFRAPLLTSNDARPQNIGSRASCPTALGFTYHIGRGRARKGQCKQEGEKAHTDVDLGKSVVYSLLLVASLQCSLEKGQKNFKSVSRFYFLDELIDGDRVGANGL